MIVAGENSEAVENAVPPLSLDCPRVILRDIAASAARSRWSKHGGLCGVLFGVTDGPVLRVRAWRAGNPEPRRGRILVDVHGDRERIETILRDAKEQAPLQALQPAGCFFARNSSALELSQPSREVYNRLFPKPWQVALALRLDGRKSVAQFYGRTAGIPRPSAPILSAEISESRPPRRRRLLIGAILGWLLAALACLALLRPGLPLRFLPAVPALGLRLASAPGSLAVLWNRRAPSLRGSSRATLEIHDAGQYYTYELSPVELERGTFAFAPFGSDVEVEMTAYPPDGAQVSEFARFVTALGK